MRGHGVDMKPAIPVTDPRFKWVSSHATDIRKTFARARKELAEQRATVVTPLRKVSK